MGGEEYQIDGKFHGKLPCKCSPPSAILQITKLQSHVENYTYVHSKQHFGAMSKVLSGHTELELDVHANGSAVHHMDTDPTKYKQ